MENNLIDFDVLSVNEFKKTKLKSKAQKYLNKCKDTYFIFVITKLFLEHKYLEMIAFFELQFLA